MPTKKKPMREFDLNLNMKWSHDIRVKAKSRPEAKKKALAILLKRLKQNDFDIY